MAKKDESTRILMDAETKRRMQELADKRKVSCGELVRTLINQSYARSK